MKQQADDSSHLYSVVICTTVATRDNGILSVIHIQDLIACSCFFWLLIRANSFESRETQPNTSSALAGLANGASMG